MRKAPGLILLFFLFQASLLSGESAEQLFVAGQKAFSQKFFSSAARNFSKLTEDYPEDSRADDSEYLLSVSFFYLGDYHKCLATLLGFKRKYRNSKYRKYIDYWQGNALYYLGRREEALELLKKQVAGYPGELYFLKYSLLLEGIILEELDRGEEAIEVYRYLLQLLSEQAEEDNLMPEVLYRLGGMELELNHFLNSRSIFSRLLFDYPESVFSSNALFFLAESYYFLEDFQAALERYERSAEAFAGHPYGDTIIFRMSRILARRGRHEDALRYLEKLESSFPASSYLQEVEQLRGEIYFDLEDYARAAAAYRKAIPVLSDKDELQALNYNLALAAYRAGLKEEAVQHFTISAAGEEEKTKENALFNLGVSLADLERNNEAIEILKNFTETFPASVHLQAALTILGDLYSQSGAAAAAEAVFTRLITYYPDSSERPAYYFKRGNSRRIQNNSKALNDFQVVIKAIPDSEMGRESLYNIGYIYSQKNEFRRALSYFTRILDGESEEDLANRTLLATGFCRYNIGEYEESLADFARLAAADDTSWSGQGFFHQGRVLYKLEKLPEAVKSFSRAAQELNSPGGRAEAIFWTGLTEFRLNSLEAARDLFLSIPALYPHNQRIAESFYRAGLCEAALENYSESIQYFDRALELSSRKTSVTTDALKGSATTLLKEEALYEKGFSLFMIGRRREAEAALQRLAEDYPGSSLVPEGYYRLASYDYEHQRYTESLKGFTQLYSDFPESGAGRAALYWAGASSVAMTEYREALDLFWRYLKSVPEGSYIKAALQEIREILTTIDSHTPLASRAFIDKVEQEEDVPAWLKNSLRYEYAAAIFSRRLEEAFDLLQKIRQDGPEEPVKSRSNFLIGRYYQETGENRRALDIFTTLAELRADRTGAEAQMNIARILQSMERREEAAEEYLKVSYIFPDYPDLVEEATFEAILLFRSLGVPEKARQLYIKLKNEFPQSRLIPELE